MEQVSFAFGSIDIANRHDLLFITLPLKNFTTAYSGINTLSNDDQNRCSIDLWHVCVNYNKTKTYKRRKQWNAHENMVTSHQTELLEMRWYVLNKTEIGDGKDEML